MKAMILNSGPGTRMKELTRGQPKCLINLREKNILARQLELLEKNGIRDIIITTGYCENQIRDFVNANYSHLNVKFVYNPKYESTSYLYSMWLAKDLIDSDILFIHGDVVFDEEIISRIINFEKENCALINNSIPPPEKDFKARIQDNKIREIGVNVFGANCFFIPPIYKLSKKSFSQWMEEIEIALKKKTT